MRRSNNVVLLRIQLYLYGCVFLKSKCTWTCYHTYLKLVYLLVIATNFCSQLQILFLAIDCPVSLLSLTILFRILFFCNNFFHHSLLSSFLLPYIFFIVIHLKFSALSFMAWKCHFLLLVRPIYNFSNSPRIPCLSLWSY